MVCAWVYRTVASVCERQKEKTKETEKAIIVCVFWLSTYANAFKRAFEKEILSLSFTLSLVKDCDYFFRV